MWFRPHKIRRTRAKQRGIALIMVLTAIAIFTAVVVDFTYSSRVELDLAANGRDEVRAYFMAKSAVNLSRLVLHFQKQLDKTMGAAGGKGGLGSIPGLPPQFAQALGGAGSPLAGMMGGGLNIQLYKLIPVDSGMLQLFLGGAGSSALGSDFDDKGGLKPGEKPETAAPEFGQDEGVLPGQKGKMKSFGDFSGSYHAEIEDEESKFNVARLDSLAADAQAAIARSMIMFGDKRYEWLYDEDDANGVRTTPKDLIINIHDFIDANQTSSVLNPQSPTQPFSDGFSDEGQPYSRYKPAYKPKNAAFDSIDELYLVDGISDRFMAAFRDRLTVFPDKNRAININTDDPFMQLMLIYTVAANPNDPALQSPLVIQAILHDIQMAKLFPGLGLSVQQFIGILQANKVQVNTQLVANLAANRVISDKTETFTIHATGEVGKAQKKLTAVIRADNALGQLMYWREE